MARAVDTATLSECFVPSWGISMQASQRSTTSWATPFDLNARPSAYTAAVALHRETLQLTEKP